MFTCAVDPLIALMLSDVASGPLIEEPLRGITIHVEKCDDKSIRQVGVRRHHSLHGKVFHEIPDIGVRNRRLRTGQIMRLFNLKSRVHCFLAFRFESLFATSIGP
jgi:hypothetical protein